MSVWTLVIYLFVNRYNIHNCFAVIMYKEIKTVWCSQTLHHIRHLSFAV